MHASNIAYYRIALLSLTFFTLALPNVAFLAETIPPPTTTFGARGMMKSMESSTYLKMGMFDFFKSRDGDFVKLQSSDPKIFGPGPLILFYNIPNGLLDGELVDMIEDGAPRAFTKGVKFIRIYPSDIESSDEQPSLGTMTVEQVLTYALKNDSLNKSNHIVDKDLVPIIYFSGISNQEMMQTYNIISNEINLESQGVLNAACAKVVEPALGKSFKQLIMEISEDHSDAMKLRIDA